MSYSLASPQPSGLQDHEVAVTLDGGLAAIFVEVIWQGNNAGAIFHASARAINADGSQQVCPNGCEVTTDARHNCIQSDIQTYGANALQKEMAQLVMGEPPTMVDATNPDGSTFQRRLIDVSDDVLANWSIRHAMSVVAQAGPVTDLSSLL